MSAKNEMPDRSESAASIKELAGDLGTLIRHEVELAKAELGEKLRSAGVGAGMLSASAVSGLITLTCLTALVAVALSLLLPAWLAVLIVTLLWGATTAVLALIGKRKVQDASPFVPEQTIANVKEDMEWARRRAKQSRT